MKPRPPKRKSSSRLQVSSAIHIIPLPGLPEIAPGDDIAKFIVIAARKQRLRVRGADVFVVTQKIISKSEGQLVRLDSIAPSPRAFRWAAKHHKDARVIELVLRRAKRILRMEKGVIVAETHHGFICANAGVDTSNAPENTALLLPKNPDQSARQLKTKLSRAFRVPVAVIISDTFGRPWREGLVNVALGVAGIAPLIDYHGTRDASGKMLQATVIALADEMASAAEIVMGKCRCIPVAIVRGLPAVWHGLPATRRAGAGHDLIRPAAHDLFR